MLDLPTSINDRMISPIREGFIFTKLRICKVSRKVDHLSIAPVQTMHIHVDIINFVYPDWSKLPKENILLNIQSMEDKCCVEIQMSGKSPIKRTNAHISV